MRTVEGVGRVAPKPVRVQLGIDGLALARKLAWQRLSYRGYGARGDQWGRGLITSADVPDGYMPILVGFAGEIAFHLWLKRATGIVAPVDGSLLPNGDGGTDFSIGSHRIQVKTAISNYKELLVKTKSFPTSRWTLIVRAQWAPCMPRDGNCLFDVGERRDYFTVLLSGWARRTTLLAKGTVEPARIGSHTNYVLESQFFQPMSDLSDLLLARKIFQEV